MASHSVSLTVPCLPFILRFINMLPRILAIFSISLIATKATDGAPAVAKARQFLPALPGYVPVYIRPGDTPLEEINLDLAEAFNSYSQKHARHAFSRSNSNFISDKLDDTEVENNPSEEESDKIKDISWEDDESLEKDISTSRKPQVDDYQHIQKIPRT